MVISTMGSQNSDSLVVDFSLSVWGTVGIMVIWYGYIWLCGYHSISVGLQLLGGAHALSKLCPLMSLIQSALGVWHRVCKWSQTWEIKSWMRSIIHVHLTERASYQANKDESSIHTPIHPIILYRYVPIHGYIDPYMDTWICLDPKDHVHRTRSYGPIYIYYYMSIHFYYFKEVWQCLAY